MARVHVVVFLAVNIVAHALCLPAPAHPAAARIKRGSASNELSNDLFNGHYAPSQSRMTAPSNPTLSLPLTMNAKDEDTEHKQTVEAPIVDQDDEDDDDFFGPTQTNTSSGGGSGIFSLLNLASALFPSSSSFVFLNTLKQLMSKTNNLKPPTIIRRSDNFIAGGQFDNEIENQLFEINTLKNFVQKIDLKKISEDLTDILSNTTNVPNRTEKSTVRSEKNAIPKPVKKYPVKINDIKLATDLKPPPARQEIKDSEEESEESEESKESNESEESNNESNNSNGSNNSDNGDEGNNGGEESFETDSQQDAAGDGNGDDSPSDEDYDEPPEGDGQGGGILGLLAGLSGGEDGQSDLGSLLAAVSGIVVNLSGDGVDVNSLIASGLGLFVGLLSEGEENPGAVIASYLVTSLDTLSGGGSKNNGQFFGAFMSKLLKGISAYVDPDASPEEGATPMKDSAGFFLSFLMGLLGDMSKGSSGSSSHHPDERRDASSVGTAPWMYWSR